MSFIWLITKTMTKELNDKAIDIKWKKYVLVSDRVIYFNETYPNGSITTERLSEGDKEVIKATVIPDVSTPLRAFTWYSQATRWDGYINKTSALENAETSAVGRALAFMGIGVIDSIASVDEMKKAWATGWKQMSDADFKKFEAVKDTYKSADEAVAAVKTKYVVDQVLEAKIRSLY